MKKFFLAVPLLFLLAAGCNQSATNRSEGQTDQSTKAQQRPQESQPTKSSKQDEMKNWKTYRNDKYGFEVKYPTQFITDVQDTSDKDYKRLLNLVIATPDHLQTYKQRMRGPLVGPDPDILFFALSASETRDPSQKPKALTKCDREVGPERMYTIDGLKVITCGEEMLGTWPTLYLEFSKNDLIWYAIRSKYSSQEEKEIVNKILSTFKFTK